MTPDAQLAVLKVTVEQEHIDRGLRGCGTRCAVALALKDMDQDDPFIMAGERTAYFRGRTWRIEPRLRQFIHDFDDGQPVAPGEYRLLAWPAKLPGDRGRNAP